MNRDTRSVVYAMAVFYVLVLVAAASLWLSSWTGDVSSYVGGIATGAVAAVAAVTMGMTYARHAS